MKPNRAFVHAWDTSSRPANAPGVESLTRRRELCFMDAMADFAVLLTGQTRLPLAPFDAACMCRWSARWGARTLTSLTNAELQVYFAELAQKGASMRDIRAEKCLLGSLYRWAARCGWTSNDPMISLDRTRVLPRQRAVYWNPAEQRRLLEACRPPPLYLRPLVLMGLRTGLRFGHLLNLEWRHVDLTQGKITIPACEVASGSVIDLSIDIDTRGVLEQLITQACKAKQGRRRVFDTAGLPAWKGRPEHHAVLIAFRTARRRAAIPDGDFDSLRLTFARNCAKACVPISYPLRISDWDDPTLVQKVYEEVEKDLRRPLFR